MREMMLALVPLFMFQQSPLDFHAFLGEDEDLLNCINLLLH